MSTLLLSHGPHEKKGGSKTGRWGLLRTRGHVGGADFPAPGLPKQGCSDLGTQLAPIILSERKSSATRE
jgi:hypothetical protein